MSGLLITRQFFNIPLDERKAFAALDLKVQREIELRLDLVEAIHLAKNRKAEYARLAALVGGSRGYSAGNLKRLYLRFVAGGKTWNALVPLYNAGEGRGLPPEFREYWRAQVMSNNRKARPMWKRLLTDWKEGKSIDGYGTWMNWWQKKHPNRPLPVRCPGRPGGWSYDNLMNYAPDEVETSLARDGFKESHHLLAQIQRDRSQLRPLEYIAFDDWQLDFRCVSPAHLQVLPLRGLGALDVGMAVLLDHVAGPCFVDDKGTRRSLAYRDMKLLLFRMLTMTGVPTGYKMHLLVENETATLTEEDAKFLSRVSNGQIIVHWTRMHHRAVLAAGRQEDHGSPWEKGWKESWVNSLHNELGDVRGQFGSDPIKAKAGDYEGRLTEAKQLIKAAAALPDELRGQIIYPFPTVEQGLVYLREAIRRLNNREEHKLQGFEQVLEWRATDAHAWEPFTTCPPALAEHVQLRKRMETPMERLERGVKGREFVQLSPAELLPLLDEKKDITVTKPFEIIFTAAGKKRTFRNSKLTDLAKPGAAFTAHWVAESFDRIYLVNEGGGYVGEAFLVAAVNPLDAEALKEQQANAAEVNNATVTRMRETMAETSLQRVAETEANGVIFARAAIEASREGDTATEANRLAQAMATGGEQQTATRAASTKRQNKKRAAVNATLAGLGKDAAAFDL